MEQDQLPQTTQPAPEQSAVSALDKDTRLFVGKNADYYAGKWAKRYKNGRPRLTVNWPAFLVSPFWLIYRKMYWQTAVFFALSIGLQVTLGTISEAASRSLSLSFPVALGLLGNTIYREHVQKKIAKLQARELSRDALDAVLCVEGGTNPAAAWILVILMVVLVSLT